MARKHKKTELGFSVTDKGVCYWYDVDEKPLWICSRIEVVALTRCQNNHHGKLLRFKDDNGSIQEWAMPKEMLAGDGTEYRRILLRKGVDISPHRRARIKLTEYLQQSHPKKRVFCVEQPGWHRHSFVLPDETIAVDNDENQMDILLQTEHLSSAGAKTKGTLQEWQHHISYYCQHNSRLAFAVSSAFAAPLLHLLNQESGGFHFRGMSSSGKTTALAIANSVWGEPSRLQLWRTTDNGLEAIAKQHNDSLLCLDELGQLDSKLAGESAYMLANGMGKLRSRKDGSGLPKQQWRLLFLSSGEISLAQHMQSSGYHPRAGQQLRLLDIPIDNNNSLGMFDSIYTSKTAAEFAQQLKEASYHYYGTPIREFLTQLVQHDRKQLQKQFTFHRNHIETLLSLEKTLEGQLQRTFNRFALVAFAGELATQWKITGWKNDTATQAALHCFTAWLQEHRTGFQEEKDALAQVRYFFEKYGNSRFETLHNPKTLSHERAGYQNQEYFLVFPEVFRREICQGLDYRFVTHICQKHDWLITDNQGKSTTPFRSPNEDKITRFYKFTKALVSTEI